MTKSPPFPLSLANQTLGGLQLWTDHVYRDGYRIQQHAITHHWRLIDARNRRLAFGDQNECDALLEQLSPRAAWNELDEPFVVLLHGLMRTSHCMVTLQRWLLHSGFPRVIRFAYASTRASIIDHGLALANYIRSLPCNCQLSFVGHSMGNIVLRAAIRRLEQAEGSCPGNQPLSRFHRVVMLGPPNHGAIIARRLAKTGVFGLITGRGAMELGPQWSEIADLLATPQCPFAVLAGDRSSGMLQNPLVDGPSDYFVGVEEARLEGAREFATMPVPHATLMTDQRALEFVTRFLKQA